MLENESLKEKFVRKGFWMYLFIFLTAPLAYLIKVMLAGSITKAEVGILYSAIGLLGLIGTYTDLGLTESLSYFLPRQIIRKAYAKAKLLFITVCISQVATSAIIGLLLYFSAGFLAESYFGDIRAKEILQILALFFVGSHLLSINSSFFGSVQNMKFQKGIDFFRAGLTCIGVAILFFSESSNTLAYTWMWIGGIYAAVFLSFYLNYSYYYKIYFSGVPLVYDKALLKTFFSYSIGTLIAANSSMLLHQLDQQFITYFTGVEEAGIYTMYLSLIGLPFIFFSPIIGFLFPVVSELHEKKEDQKLAYIYTLLSSYFSSFMIWIAGFFFFFGEELAIFFFGTEYILSGTATQFISLFLVWNILIQISFQFMSGLGYVKKRIEISLYTLVVNVSLVLFFIWISKNTNLLPSASSGAAFAVGLSWIFMWYLCLRLLRQYMIGFYWKLFFMNILGAIIWILGVLVAKEYTPDTIELSRRILALLTILFAFFSALTIFLLINRSSLRSFIDAIRSTKNIIRS